MCAMFLVERFAFPQPIIVTFWTLGLLNVDIMSLRYPGKRNVCPMHMMYCSKLIYAVLLRLNTVGDRKNKRTKASRETTRT